MEGKAVFPISHGAILYQTELLMRYKRAFAVLTLLMMLLSCQSCGRITVTDVSSSYGDIPTPVETWEDESADGCISYAEYERYGGYSGKNQFTKYLDEIGAGDMGGMTVIIASPDTEYISPDDTGNELSRYAVERNAAVEDELNIRLVSTSVSIGTMVKQLKQSALAGKERYDILMLPLNEVGRLAYDGLLIDMSAESKIDPSAPYFNISSAAATSFGGAVYGIAGYGSIVPTSYSAVFMNTEILRDSGIDPTKLYSAAERGEWTWDDFITYTETVGAVEMFGTVTSQSMADSFADAVFVSSGNSYLWFDSDGIASVGYDPDSAFHAVEYISTLMNDPAAVISDEISTVGNFAAGRTAFAVERLYVMSWLINSDAQWGLLPLPKADEKGEYRSLVAEDTLVFVIPLSSHDKSASAVTVAAINAASEGYIYEQFVTYSMNNVLRDNESVGMLDIILDSAVFDRGITYDERFPSLAAITALIRESADSEDWAKTYEKMAKEANKILADELPIYFVEDEPEETEPPETDAPETETPETDAPETKPAETKPAETKPAETKPAETKPAETKPAETKPAETKPAETKPAETKPAETKPAETKPAETKPAETKPAETAIPETAPAEITPPETDPPETK